MNKMLAFLLQGRTSLLLVPPINIYIYNDISMYKCLFILRINEKNSEFMSHKKLCYEDPFSGIIKHRS